MDTLRALDHFLATPLPERDGVPYTRHFDGGAHSTHVVFGVCTHGDETGPLAAALDLLDDLVAGRTRYGGQLTIFVGNPEAARAGVRFLEADLNRVFTAQAAPSHERRRAEQLSRVLDTADVFLDVHQTILPSAQPFFIGPYGDEVYAWMRALAVVDAWVTRPPGERFSTGTCCADEYVRLRDKPGFTVELGQRGFTRASRALAGHAFRRALGLVDRIAAGEATLRDVALAEPPLRAYRTVAATRWSDAAMALRPHLVNFTPVQAGEDIAAPGSPPIIAPEAGVVLFPKYPPPDQPRPLDIVNFITPLDQSPATLWGDGGLQ